MTLWVYIPLDITSQVSDTVSVKAIGRYGISDQIVLTTTILAFQESGGQVVMEAEHFAGNGEREGKSWITQTTLANYSSSGYVSAWPDTDLHVITSYTSSPELSYTINFTTTGVYTVSLKERG